MRLLLASLALTAACSGAASSDATRARDTLTQRQKDSLTAQSALPGARGVGGALSAQDSAVARNRVVDSIATTP